MNIFSILKKIRCFRESRTCAQDSKELVILCSEFENLKHESGETVNKNCATVEYKILAQHCNDFASLKKEPIERVMMRVSERGVGE